MPPWDNCAVSNISASIPWSVGPAAAKTSRQYCTRSGANPAFRARNAAAPRRHSPSAADVRPCRCSWAACRNSVAAQGRVPGSACPKASRDNAYPERAASTSPRAPALEAPVRSRRAVSTGWRMFCPAARAVADPIAASLSAVRPKSRSTSAWERRVSTRPMSAFCCMGSIRVAVFGTGSFTRAGPVLPRVSVPPAGRGAIASGGNSAA